MEKKKLPSFLSRKELLTNKENTEYQGNKQAIQRRSYLKENKQLKSINKFQTRQERYDKSSSGKFSNFLGKGIKTTSTRGGVTRSLYSHSIQPSYNQGRVRRGINNGRKGRPVGTVKHYDERGNPIGVYDWRKLQAQRHREQLQRATINPAQQRVMNQIAQRNAYNAQNEEAKVIPSTKGNVYLGGIMDEIDRATRLVD